MFFVIYYVILSLIIDKYIILPPVYAWKANSLKGFV